MNRKLWSLDLLYTSIACAFIYILVCAGGTCGAFTHDCSTNSDCVCLQTTDGNGLCDPVSKWRCDQLPDCSDCPAATHACIINTCCRDPKCNPRTSDCPAKNGNDIFDSHKSRVLKRVQCNEDKDCDFGKSCTLHPTGRFCVWLIT